MTWPLRSDLVEALEHPFRAFQGADLRRGRATLDSQGRPRVFSGVRADVFQIRGTADAWAVKFYRQPEPALAEHYEALREYLLGINVHWLLETQYLPHGFLLHGRSFPILKMRWADGVPLRTFVKQHVHEPLRLRQCAEQWQRLARELRHLGIAHGALQPEHVLVAHSPLDNHPVLRLIDYDGLFVPSLAGRSPQEVGDAPFQHPQRLWQKLYDADVDRFPLLLVFTALHALAVGGVGLWERFDTGSNLLFREEDFSQPGTSGIFRELWRSPDTLVRTLAGQLLLASQGAPAQVPLLDDLLPEVASWVAAGPVAALPLTPAQEVRIEGLLLDLNVGSGDTTIARPVAGNLKKTFGILVEDAPEPELSTVVPSALVEDPLTDNFNLEIEDEPHLASTLQMPALTLDVPLPKGATPPPLPTPLPQTTSGGPPPLPMSAPVVPPPLPVVLAPQHDAALVFHLEAWMPERIAVMKLQGFVDANHGEVMASLPGLVRVHLLDPYELANPPRQSVFAWLGLVQQPPPQPRVLAAIELHMECKETEFKKLLKMKVRFLPGQGPAQALNRQWRRFCEKMFCELRGFLMGGQ